MAWKFLQVCGFAATSTSASARTTSFTANVAAGSLLAIGLVTFGTAITVTVSDNVNGSWIQAGSYTTGNISYKSSIWYFQNSGSGSVTITVTPNVTAFVTMFACEYSGIATSALDSTSTNNGTSASPATGNVTVNQAGDLIFGVGCPVANISGSTTVLAGAGGNMRGGELNTATIACFVSDISADSTSSLVVCVTSTSNTWVANGASFKAAASGSGGGNYQGSVNGVI